MEVTIGNWVRQGRRRLDLTQTALASEVGCTESMLKKIEAGVRTPSPPLQARFELLLGSRDDRGPRPSGLSAELFTIIIADGSSEHVVDDFLHDLAGGFLPSGLGSSSVLRLLTVDGHAVLAVSTPTVGRLVGDEMLERGAVRVVVHCGVGSADAIVSEAAEIFGQSAPGLTESPAHAAIAGLRPSLRAQGEPPVTHFANTGRVPRQPNHLVGRVDFLEQLVPMLTDRSARLITLTGPGGVGKTVLGVAAIEAARRVRPTPVVAVDLSVAGHATEANETLAAALRTVGTDQPGSTWIERLSSWSGILLIDSAEHVRAISELLERLVAETPMTILVTSRSRLGLRVERELAVSPLSTTAWNGQRSDAAELFRQRAAFTGASGAGQQAVEDLCARLDGLPLAIELAAARTLQLPVSAMTENIAIRVADLSDSSPGLTPRHRTLRATLEWSLSLLEPVSLSALRRLAVVEGSFDFDAVTRIGLRWPQSRMSPEALLDDLVSNSLAFRTQVHPRGSPEADAGSEWQIYGTLREVLRSSLDPDEQRQAQSDHAAWIFDVAERLAPELYGPNQEESFERLLHSLPDLRCGISRAIETGDAGRCAQVLSALQRFWSRAGLFSDARMWSVRLLLCELRPGTRARLLNTMGTLAFLEGDSEAAIGPLTSSQILFAEVGDHQGEADALANLGVCFGQLGRREPGVSCTERSLELRRRIGDRRGVAISLGNLGQFASLHHDLDAGRRYLSESVAVHREIDDGYLLVEALQDLARIEAADDRPDRAGAHLLEALSIADRLRAGRMIASVLEALVDVSAPDHLRMQRCRLGARLIGAAQAARRRAGLPSAVDDTPSVAHIAGSLGPRAWDAHLAEGAAMSAADIAETAERFAHRARHGRDPVLGSPTSLSARELRVLRLLGDGATNKDIARELSIRPSTVASHVRTLFAKLGVGSRAAAVAAAADHGLR